MRTISVALPLLRPTLGTEFSYVISDDGQVVAGHGIAPLALLPAADTLVLIAPARALSWHQVRLPPLSSGRMRAALEGLMEERLLDEPGGLAFAVGPQRTPDGAVQVAVCDRAWLHGALELFELAKRPASRVVPEFAPGPQPRVFITGTAPEPWAALVDAQGVLCTPLGGVPAMLGVFGPGPDDLAVAAHPAVAALAEQVLARPVEIVPPAQCMLASCQGGWELAQFDLAISSRGRIARRWAQSWQRLAHAPAWRPMRWGLVVLVAANLLGLNAWAWRQQAQLQAKRDEVRSLFVQAFPKVKTIVDAPLQMERELARLQQTTGSLAGRDLEALLGAVGVSMPIGPAATAIEFAPGELVLKGGGLTSAQMPALSDRLAGLGYTARLDGERLVVRVAGK